jgi:hypothetical protein
MIYRTVLCIISYISYLYHTDQFKLLLYIKMLLQTYTV